MGPNSPSSALMVRSGAFRLPSTVGVRGTQSRSNPARLERFQFLSPMVTPWSTPD